MHSLRRTTLLAALAVLVTVFAFACNGSSSSPTSPTVPAPTGSGGGTTGGSSPDVTITIVGMAGSQSFSPNPGVVKAGQTVAWHNGDVITHTATADNGAFDTGAIAPGATSAAIKMTSAGSIGYHCSIHPSMVGTLQVQ
jgi:plastocyanin